MADIAFLFDGMEFSDTNSFALYLKNNFRKSITYLGDDSLYTLLKNQFPSIYEEAIDLSKDYKYKENIVTLIIYLLDNTLGVNIANYSFSSTHEIADVMKKTYPNPNEEIQKLLCDKVLSHIFWKEYERTLDTRYKRNYTFMLKVNENIEHSFVYYYFLFIHLSKNEVVRFTLDGVKMKSLSEITIYLSEHIDRANIIINEIIQNPFILALMAVGSGIEQISLMLNSNNSLEILKVLSTYAECDLSVIIQQKMSYWLLINHKNYVYETPEANELYLEYQKIATTLNLNSLNDYVQIYDIVEELYKKFVQLFNHNHLIEYKKGITSSEDYYLSYRLNGELVCKKFLFENGLYSSLLANPIHQECVEREVLVDALEVEKNSIEDFRNEVCSLTNELYFDNRFLKRRLFISYMYLILLLASLCGGLLLGFNQSDLINYVIDLGVFLLLGISLALTIIAIFKYTNKLSNSFLVELARDNSLLSINEIKKEQSLILNPDNHDIDSPSLMNAAYYQKNRKNDLLKISKISTKKTTVSNWFLIIAGELAMLPIFEFGLKASLLLANQFTFEIYLNGISVSLISLGVMALQLILLSIFRKRHIVYYLVYLYLAIVAMVSIIIF